MIIDDEMYRILKEGKSEDIKFLMCITGEKLFGEVIECKDNTFKQLFFETFMSMVVLLAFFADNEITVNTIELFTKNINENLIKMMKIIEIEPLPEPILCKKHLKLIISNKE